MVADATARRRGIAVVRWLAVAAVVLVLVIVLWNRGQDVIDGQTSNGLAYLLTTLLVFGDALVPVLPGETTLNAACVLAANGKLQLGLVMLCGAVGAVTGDSTLYWLARKATGRVRRWLDRAEQGQAGAKVKDLLGRHGRIFLLFGRYVPGLRFALNVTLGGVVRMPYPTFLLWSGLSGTLWSVWVCLSAYFISSALAGYPIASIIVSTCAGTVLISGAVWLSNRHHRAVRPTSDRGGERA